MKQNMSFFSYTFAKDFSSRRTKKGVIAVRHADTKQPRFGGIAPAMIVCKEKQGNNRTTQVARRQMNVSEIFAFREKQFAMTEPAALKL